jgi:large subunit ribosomal protein L23
MNSFDIIKNPLTTEKAVRLMESENKLIFIVDKKATKPEIKKAMEEVFKVKVVKVNTTIQRGKKKAYIRLAKETPAIDVATQLGLM